MKEKDVFKLVRYGFAIIQSVITLLFLYFLSELGVLPQKYFFIILGILVFLCVLNVLLQFKKIPGIIMMVIGIIISVILGVVCIYIVKTTDVMNKTAGADEQIDKMVVYVLGSDEANSLGDAADYTYGILSTRGREATDKAVDEINKTISKEIAVREYDDFFTMIDALYAGEVKAIILNEAYIDVIIETEGYEDFKDKVKELLMTEVKSKVEWYETDDTGIKLNSDVFTLYISGIDTHGSVAKTSRSDVNIIAVVNTKTKQILLVSTPRDYYVPLSISNGVKDKLTHAGIYGINCSKDTLSMLYDIDIQYYFRLNFDGFVKIIDELGGVTVHSDCAFQSSHIPTMYVNEGDNTFNGKEALAFARERYHLADGDRQRGKNQMEVIKAVINKMASSKLLYNYADIMEAISDCFQTSMPKDVIQSLVKMQINDMKKWNIVSYSANGSGTRSTTYSMPKFNAYVMIPDESTIEHAKELISQVVDGKVISE